MFAHRASARSARGANCCRTHLVALSRAARRAHAFIIAHVCAHGAPYGHGIKNTLRKHRELNVIQYEGKLYEGKRARANEASKMRIVKRAGINGIMLRVAAYGIT